VLTKDLLRVSRRGGGYRPSFVGPERRDLAAAVLDAYRSRVGERRAAVDGAVEAIERDADDYKLVRGFAALVERDATFETRAAVRPERARRAAFEAAERVGVVTIDDRATALTAAADRLGVAPDDLDDALQADRETNQVLTAVDPRWEADALLEQYNLSLAQTALFDATEVRIRSADPKALVSAVKRLGLLYEVRRLDAGDDGVAGDAEGGAGDDGVADATREVVVTGPDALFRTTRRYGTSFARLLRSVATAPDWRLWATIDDRGTERELVVDGDDVTVPGVEPIAEATYDSGVEADFAARFGALDVDWRLSREPDPLATGSRVMIPDFAFDWTGSTADFRVYFEIMGFWTPDYADKKLSQVAGLADVELVVAVDESLGVGAELAARDARVVPYSGSVRVKDVVDVLREYEADLVADAAADLPAELRPDADVTTLATVADGYGVTPDALDAAGVAFPDHERVGGSLLRPRRLAAIDDDLDPGASYADVEAVLDEYGVDDADASALLSRLGYRVEWAGLGGGTLRERPE
jgi:predicted nuclease of restriction endonuclease-like RecB superfamily